MQTFALSLVASALCCPLFGTTLQQMTLDELARQSTQIVRGKAQLGSASARGSMIYTHYRIQIAEQWKGNWASQVDVAVPGGEVNGRRQSFAGAPVFADGQEYIFFLWTSRTGLTQVIGLSQGMFQLQAGVSGTLMVTRTPSSQRVLDGNGKEIVDPAISLPLPDFKDKVSRILATKAGQ